MPAETLKSGAYTAGQAARVCRASPRVVHKWVDSGLLKGYRLPGSKDRRILRADLLKFLIAHGLPLDLMGELSAEEQSRADAGREVPPALAG